MPLRRMQNRNAYAWAYVVSLKQASTHAPGVEARSACEQQPSGVDTCPNGLQSDAQSATQQ